MSYSLGILLLVGSASGQTQTDYYTAVTGAARELSSALDTLQRSFATIPTQPVGRGLYQQLDPVQLNLLYFRQQVQRKIPRDDLYLAFDKVDGGLTNLVGELVDISKWDPALQLAIRRVRAAQHDLHFAISGGDKAPARQTQVAYRQTLALLTRLEDLQNLVRYVFNEQDALPGWDAEFKDLRAAVNGLQRLEKNGSRAEQQQQMAKTELAWEKLVARMRLLPESQHVLLRADFGQVDRAFARLAGLLNVVRRPPLKAEEY
jgi:hypothetical protein